MSPSPDQPPASRVRWALVSAPRGQLSLLTGEVARALVARGAAVAGFLQARDGEAQSLLRVATGERVPLSRDGSSPREGEEPFCSTVIRPAAFAFARRWLEEDGAGAAVWVLDGLSKLEAGRKGHFDTARWAFAHAGRRPLVLGVRADQLFDVMGALELEHEPLAALEGQPDAAALARFLDAVLAAPA